MSALDLMEELEAMAQLATDHDAGTEEVDDIAIQRWQWLFGYSYSEAAKKAAISQGEHRPNHSSPRIRQGGLRTCMPDSGLATDTNRTSCSGSQGHTFEYLLKMESPLHSIDTIKAAARLSEEDGR
ncbi:hypothetical protein N657DRAFT_637009 [Parathielavia appendiculata]|uniref:Uncharacterized protein n=1 Tax=Parathielavia appendiculata TaxID=2587402 RepID=A0AAN6TSH5_9PEZI|nr:hypothetical protein N657DRAFT_637009 [Parathielavia appendiculata]